MNQNYSTVRVLSQKVVDNVDNFRNTRTHQIQKIFCMLLLSYVRSTCKFEINNEMENRDTAEITLNEIIPIRSVGAHKNMNEYFS